MLPARSSRGASVPSGGRRCTACRRPRSDIRSTSAWSWTCRFGRRTDRRGRRSHTIATRGTLRPLNNDNDSTHIWASHTGQISPLQCRQQMHCFHCYKHQFNGPSSATSTATKKKKNVQSYLNHSYSILWSLNHRVDACLGPAVYCISTLTLVLISSLFPFRTQTDTSDSPTHASSRSAGRVNRKHGLKTTHSGQFVKI